MGAFLIDLSEQLLLDLLLIAGLFVCLHSDHYISAFVKRIFRFSLILLLVMLCSISLNTFLTRYPFSVKLHTFSSCVSYCIRPFLIFFLDLLLTGKRKHKWLILVPGINTLIYFIGLFTPITFRFTEENNFWRGPLGYSAHIAAMILLIIFLIDTVPILMHESKHIKILYSLCIFPIVISALAETFLTFSDNIGPLLHTIVFSAFIYYYILHLIFVRSHEKSLLEEYQSHIMLSQIQPHFLYNSLFTIQALCRIDPELASKTIGDFSAYLRQNMDSINQTAPIPFNKELEHTKLYVSIEKLRFPNIDVTFDIEDTNFTVPSLSLQPLVENAIRHGVRIREHGHIHVHSYYENKKHMITVTDNGVGFDISKLSSDLSSSDHVGILNVKTRIELVKHGQLDIYSKIDEGTRITITIPEEK